MIDETIQETLCEGYIRQTLSYIDSQKIMEPITILDILSKHSTLKLGLVKDFFMTKLVRLETSTNENQTLYKAYMEEAKGLKADKENLTKKFVLYFEEVLMC